MSECFPLLPRQKVRFCDHLTEDAVNEIIVEEAQTGWRVKQILYAPIGFRDQLAILFTIEDEKEED